MEAVRRSFPPRAVIDGEIVIAGDGGLDFWALQQRIHPASSRVDAARRGDLGRFIAFDLLALVEKSYGDAFAEHPSARDGAVGAAPPATSRRSGATRPIARAWLDASRAPGSTAWSPSDADLTYQPDKRVMTKIKHVRTADCVAAGYRVQSPARRDTCTALHRRRPRRTAGSGRRHAGDVRLRRRALPPCPDARRDRGRGHAATLRRDGSPVHLPDVPPDEGLPARQDGAQRHHARVPARAPRSACSATTAPGKSTLLRIMAGIDTDFQRRRDARPRRDRRPARAGAPARRDQGRARATSRTASPRRKRAARPLQRAGRQLLRRDGRRVRRSCRPRSTPPTRWNLDTNVEYAMDALRLPPADADVTKLSGGERRRVALCRLLLSAPDLLLLDEPTNHLDAESVAWLERHLAEYKGTVVAVTHDRYFLDNVAGWILELDRGARHPLRGQLLELARAEAEAPGAWRRRPRRPRQRTIAAELEWVRQNPKGRQTKQKARLHELRGARRPGAQRQARRGPDPHPDRHAPGQRRRRGREPAQGLRRQAADRGPRASRCRPAASSASSAPTAPARRRSSG